MTATRYLILAVLLLSCATSGIGQPEPAPPPKEKATPAELLVGQWRLDKYGGVKRPDKSETIEAFAKDGKYISTVKGVGRATETYTATYQVQGNEIVLKADRQDQREKAVLRILKLTRSELILQHGEEDGFKVAELSRLEPK
ncbi:MAG: hypothetical protein U0804_12125 [Gemmataceae bacterium]